MFKTKEMDAKTQFLNRFSNFIHKNRILLLTMLITGVVFLVGYFVWTEWQRKTNESSTLLVEEAQELFKKWQAELDEDKKKDIEEDLKETLDLITNRYSRHYAAQRALFIRASLAFEKEEWKSAAEDFLKAAVTFRKSYLAPLSIFNAAICYDEADNADQSIDLYHNITEEYKESYLIPHVIFSLGHIYEQKEDFGNALLAYNRLENEYPSSNWTKAGRNRIIDLRIEGKIKE